MIKQLIIWAITWGAIGFLVHTLLGFDSITQAIIASAAFLILIWLIRTVIRVCFYLWEREGTISKLMLMLKDVKIVSNFEDSLDLEDFLNEHKKQGGDHNTAILISEIIGTMEGMKMSGNYLGYFMIRSSLNAACSRLYSAQS